MTDRFRSYGDATTAFIHHHSTASPESNGQHFWHGKCRPHASDLDEIRRLPRESRWKQSAHVAGCAAYVDDQDLRVRT